MVKYICGGSININYDKENNIYSYIIVKCCFPQEVVENATCKNCEIINQQFIVNSLFSRQIVYLEGLANFYEIFTNKIFTFEPELEKKLYELYLKIFLDVRYQLKLVNYEFIFSVIDNNNIIEEFDFFKIDNS